jgi:hypothetical protein
MLEQVVVALIVLAALAFVIRRMTGYVPKKKRAPKPGPDVPVGRLVRRKDEKR